MALNGQRPPDHFPVDHNQVAADVEALHHASKKKDEVCYFIIIIIITRNSLTWFQVAFFEILINRSNPHVAAV
jgi:hypothetical protein